MVDMTMIRSLSIGPGVRQLQSFLFGVRFMHQVGDVSSLPYTLRFNHARLTTQSLTTTAKQVTARAKSNQTIPMLPYRITCSQNEPQNNPCTLVFDTQVDDYTKSNASVGTDEVPGTGADVSTNKIKRAGIDVRTGFVEPIFKNESVCANKTQSPLTQHCLPGIT